MRGLRFNRIAATYDRVRPGYPRQLLDTALRDRTVTQVLEVGCGTGQLTGALVARGLEVQGVEPGPSLAELARKRAPGAVIHLGRFEDVSLPDAAFDAVFSASAFHWIDPAVGWAKAARVLRPGGTLALLSHVYVTDDATRAAHEAAAAIYGADWRLRPEEEVLAGARDRRGNVSEVLAWLDNPTMAVPEAAQLFGEVELDAVPERYDLDAGELLDLQRTTATHLYIDPADLDRVERKLVELVERLGGRFPIRQVAIAAVAERR